MRSKLFKIEEGKRGGGGGLSSGPISLLIDDASEL